MNAESIPAINCPMGWHGLTTKSVYIEGIAHLPFDVFGHHQVAPAPGWRYFLADRAIRF